MNETRKAIWPGWETVRLIGRGSFGAVYEIERDVLGEKEKAALKLITIPENSSDIEALRDEGYDDASITGTFKEHLKSIVAEYALMRKLNGNTNVVNCDDVRYVQHDDGFGWDIFIKMELLTPMKKALGMTVSDGKAIRVGMDICRALMLCKLHNIIHRDIKPDNIFVSDSGDYKLGDFGIAKTMERTTGGTKIGTYEYMAPEVYRGFPYGSTADIYSLGMVLYWLLNERRTPFLPLPPAAPSASGKESARLRRFGGEALPAPAHGSKELQRIVLKACAYDPKDRYQSAEELLRALQALDGRAVPALDPKPETVPEPSAAPAVDEDDERTVSAFGQGASDKQSEEKNQSEPATLSENAAEDEDAEEKTVSVFSRPIGEATGTKPPAAPAAPQPEEDEQTVAEFVRLEEKTKKKELTADELPILTDRTEMAKTAEVEDEYNETIKTNHSDDLTQSEKQYPHQNPPKNDPPRGTMGAAEVAALLLAFVCIVVLAVVGIIGIRQKNAVRALGENNERSTEAVERDVASTIQTWIFDEITGTLYIGGTGAMANNRPWAEYLDRTTKVAVDKGVTSIGISAFRGCTRLETIDIPDSVTFIDIAAFSGCDRLKNVFFPMGVDTIGEYAFYNCTSIDSIVIPDGMTMINSYTFSGCSSLTYIGIPESVTYISYSAFGSCESLQRIAYSGTPEQWERIRIAGGNEALLNAQIDYNTSLS